MELAQQTLGYTPEEFMVEFSQADFPHSTKMWAISPARLSTLRHEGTHSSLGRLDALPTELIFKALDRLDFRSLCRFIQVSVKGKAVVESFPAYKDMMKHAPRVLAALSRTGMLRHHASALLQQTLRSSKCASCLIEFGGFLFMPTCERLCLQCLRRNHAFRMTTSDKAKQFFGLTDAHLERIPTFRPLTKHQLSILGRKQKRARHLFSVKQVKQLAIEVHGSMEDVKEVAVPPTNAQMAATNLNNWSLRMFENFLNAPLEPPGYDFSLQPGKVPLERDDYVGMAYIRFPSVMGEEVERGMLCKGCGFVVSVNLFGKLSDELEKLVPPEVDKVTRLAALECRMRPIDELREHIKECYGVHLFLNGWTEASLFDDEGDAGENEHENANGEGAEREAREEEEWHHVEAEEEKREEQRLIRRLLTLLDLFSHHGDRNGGGTRWGSIVDRVLRRFS